MGELATIKHETRLALEQPMEFSTEQIRILAETVAKGCDQNELGFFINVCKMKRLDPFSGQIHVVKRWDSDAGREKMAIQTGIDGYRVIAARTGEMAGSDDPIYDSEDGAFPKWAKVTVHRYGRENEKIPYTATARWSEYVQTKKDGAPTKNWREKPFLMLGKCAEALALRKGFPDELSGLYTDEEMEQADNHHPGQPDAKPPVQMPQSTKQTQAAQAQQTAKPAQQATQQTVPAQNGQQGNTQEKIAGAITKVLTSKNGVLGLIIGDKTAVVPAKMAMPEMVPGAKVVILVEPRKKTDGTPFLEAVDIQMVVPEQPVEEGEIINAEPVVEPGDAALESEELKGMFDDRPPQTQRAKAQPKDGEPDKPGTAGFGRGQRIHILITQNHKNTGFGEEELARFLKSIRLEHARHLPFVKGDDNYETNFYKLVEDMATGQADWHLYVPD